MTIAYALTNARRPLISSQKPRIALRMDDVGASSKYHEIYSKRWYGFGNILFLKRMQRFKAWGPYNELTGLEWRSILFLLRKYNAKLTVAVTAAWVESDASLVPYPQKWPEAFRELKLGVDEGLVSIASHGLTHCVLQDRAFLPNAFTSNRRAHREFWDWLPYETHRKHLIQSKDILENCFQCPINTLIPPGNVFSQSTIDAAREVGFSFINCATESRNVPGLRIIGNTNVAAFHDREVVLFGIQWFEKLLASHVDNDTVFIHEL